MKMSQYFVGIILPTFNYMCLRRKLYDETLVHLWEALTFASYIDFNLYSGYLIFGRMKLLLFNFIAIISQESIDHLSYIILDAISRFL